MPKQVKRIEGGTSKPYSDLEPTQTFEKNLGFISNTTVTHLGGPLSYKKMQEDFVFLAPIVAANVKPWEDRNVKNNNTKLNNPMPKTTKTTIGESKVKKYGNMPKGNTYYLYDKNYNKGWLPGGADNPITTFAKGIVKITTGIDIPNKKSLKAKNRGK